MLDSVLVLQNNTCARVVWPSPAAVLWKRIAKGTEGGTQALLPGPRGSNAASDGYCSAVERKEQGARWHPQD